MNRYESTKLVSIFGILGNIFLLIIKLFVAIISHSMSLFADAINSAGDIASAIMTYIGNKIASAPKDEDHNFGHGKAEYIFSLFISISMIFIATKILFNSVTSIIERKEFIFSPFLIIVCILTIITKLTLYIYCKKVYQKHKNILVKASMKDHKNDVLLTTCTLISIIFGYFGIYLIDGIVGAIISIYILFSGFSIFLESYKILMDISLNKEEKEKIIEFISKNKTVLSISDFSTIAVGYKYIAIITIEVDGNLSTFVSHDIADSLEKEIVNNFKKVYQAIIHVNPR